MRLGRLWIPPLLAALASLVGFQLWLPHRVERALQEAIVGSGVSVHRVVVELRSFPAIELLGGRVDRLRLQLRDVQSEVPVKSADLDLTGISFNASAVMSGQPLQISSVAGGRAVVTITQEALNSYFSRTLGSGTSVTIALVDGVGVLRGIFKLAGLRLELTLTGRFVPAGSGLRFVPNDMSIMDAEVPSFLLRELEDQLALNIPLGDLPVPMEVTEVTADRGQLRVIAVPSRR